MAGGDSGIATVTVNAPTGGSSTQTITDSGIGATPKCVYIQISHSTNQGSTAADAVIGFGASDGTTARAYSLRSEDNVSLNTDTSGRRDNSTVVYLVNPNNNALDGSATLSSFISNGCELNWTNFPASAYEMVVTFFYGDDMKIEVVDEVSSATEGAEVTVTGLDFAPRAIVANSTISNWGPTAGHNHARFSGGFAVKENGTTGGISQASFTLWDHDNSGTSTVGTNTRDDSILAFIRDVSGAIEYRSHIEITEFTTDGWVMTTRGGAFAQRGFFIAFDPGGAMTWVDVVDLDNASTGSKQLGNSFIGDTLFCYGTNTLIANLNSESNAGIEINSSFSFGIATTNAGVASGSVGYQVENGAVSASNANSVSDTSLVRVTDMTGGILWEAGVDLPSGGENRINVTNASTVDVWAIFLVIGPALRGRVAVDGEAHARANGTRYRTAVGRSTGGCLARAVGTVTAAAPNNAISIGEAHARGTGVVNKVASSVATAGSVARAVATRIRTAAALSHGEALNQGAASRTRSAQARSHGEALSQAVGVRYAVAQARSHGEALARGAGVRYRSAVARSLGEALARGTGVRIATGQAVSLATGLARGAASRTRSATTRQQGEAQARAQATRTRTAKSITFGEALSRGLGTVNAVVAITAQALSLAESLATGVGTRLRSRNAQSKGAALAFAAASVVRGARARVMASALARSTATRLRTGRATSFGTALARAGMTEITPKAITFGVALSRAIGTITTTCISTDTPLDSRILPRALSILQRLGRTVDFTVNSSKAYDRTTGLTAFTGSTVSATVSPPLFLERSIADASGRQKGDAQLILAAQGLTFTPLVEQIVEFDGTTWQIVQVDPVYSGNQVAVYVLVLRGGVLPTTTSRANNLDDRLPATALGILTRLGRDVTHVTSTDSYARATGLNTETESSATVKSSPPIAYEDRYVDGDIVRRGDCMLVLQGSTDLAVGDRFDIDGKRWQVVFANPIYSGGLIAAWIAQVRGAGLPNPTATSVQNSLDSRLPARVKSIISRFGKVAKFKPISSRVYNQETGLTTEAGVCEFCEKVVLDERSDAGTVEMRNVTAYLEAHTLGFTPYKSMEVELDSTEWDTTEVEPVYSGGKIALWILKLER